jgi:hypothetical protein
MLARMQRKKEPLYTVDGNVNCAATMEVSREVPQKSKNRTTTWSCYTTPGYHKESKAEYNRDTCTPMFIAALSTTAKLWNQPRCSSTDG